MAGRDHQASRGDPRRILDLTVRRERGRMLAGLIARFGAQYADIAEDAVQDALVEALESWAFRGLPDNAGAVLSRMARYRMIDRLRRTGRDSPLEGAPEPEGSPSKEVLLSGDIADETLRTMVLCCDPALPPLERLTLTLKFVSGFTAREIATVLWSGEAAIGQRTARGLRRLREKYADDGTLDPSRFDLRARLPMIRKSLYLLFTLGYHPRVGELALLADLCHEALRLALMLSNDKADGAPETMALVALFSFQAARFEARGDAAGGIVLLRDQKRTLWDSALIAQGNEYLRRARGEGRPSRYHLEAAIAGLYSNAPDWQATDWASLDTLYGALEAETGSPVVAANRCVAMALAGEPRAALEKLSTLTGDARFAKAYPLALIRAEVLAAAGDDAAAAAAREEAMGQSYSAPARDLLAARRAGTALGALV